MYFLLCSWRLKRELTIGSQPSKIQGHPPSCQGHPCIDPIDWKDGFQMKSSKPLFHSYDIKMYDNMEETLKYQLRITLNKSVIKSGPKLELNYLRQHSLHSRVERGAGCKPHPYLCLFLISLTMEKHWENIGVVNSLLARHGMTHNHLACSVLAPS